jgi:hypothetical protein
MELMLDSWIFFIKKAMLIKIIKLILLIKKLHSKGLEISIPDVGEKNKTLFDVCKGPNMVKWTKKYIHPNPKF